HPLGINLQSLDEFLELLQHVIEQNRRIRQNDSLGTGMANVAFMPKSDFFQPDDGVAPEDTREAAQSLARYRVPFVRHRRAALLSLGKKFFDFQNFGSLQMAKLGRPFV